MQLWCCHNCVQTPFAWGPLSLEPVLVEVVMGTWNRGWMVAAALVFGCADAETTTRPVMEMDPTTAGEATGGDIAPVCVAGTQRSCNCFGAVGFERCDGTGYGACECPMDAGVVQIKDDSKQLENCDPGIYEGTFECDYAMMSGGFGDAFPIHVEGPVGFDLQVAETAVDPNCQEFCFDLVIKEGSGKLFGLAGLMAFEAQLEGGLDCSTGEFQATVKNGSYGGFAPVDPNDPNGPLMVTQPPFGTFEGTMAGLHNGAVDQTIAGNWALMPVEITGSCDGPFTATRVE